MIWRARTPEHCVTCGDELVEATYNDGFQRDGTQIVRKWKKCPRNGQPRPTPLPEHRQRTQRGQCMPLYPMSCANEVRAWNDHKPWWHACEHYSVSETGDKCWTKDGRQLTGEGAQP